MKAILENIEKMKIENKLQIVKKVDTNYDQNISVCTIKWIDGTNTENQNDISKEEEKIYKPE